MSGGSLGKPEFLAYCQAKSISVPGTKNEPGSEAISDKNLVHRERAVQDEGMNILPLLVSENAMMRDSLILARVKELAAQPPQMIQLIGERRLSQNGSDEVDGEGLLVGIRAHELVNPGGLQIPLRNSTRASVENKPRT